MSRLSEYTQNKLNQLVDDNNYFLQKQYESQMIINNVFTTETHKRHLAREIDLYKIESAKIKKEIKEIVNKYSIKNKISKVSNTGYFTVVPKTTGQRVNERQNTSNNNARQNISNNHTKRNTSNNRTIQNNNNPPPYWWLGGAKTKK